MTGYPSRRKEKKIERIESVSLTPLFLFLSSASRKTTPPSAQHPTRALYLALYPRL